MEPDAVHGPAPVLRWAMETSHSEGKPKRSATAGFNGFRLLVVEMGEAFLAGKPLFLPQVSWCLGWGPEPDDVRVGGPAPTFEDVMAQAELALCIQVRAEMDS